MTTVCRQAKDKCFFFQWVRSCMCVCVCVAHVRVCVHGSVLCSEDKSSPHTGTRSPPVVYKKRNNCY